ncbi:hypothetical protein CEP51_001309 [Fusarium floridanum]|uniref:Uncharacterized protein n=1 Tax=Fusarium floridanum TaxID=1325733 RepID=A0A428SHP4_9HYPO|nr:hypothetical protein CEP51_001309 [Fusarium floridanum]
MEVPVTVVPQKPTFIFDRTNVETDLNQAFDRELSLRWQFLQVRADKSLPFVLLPRLIRPPQYLDNLDQEKRIDGFCVIVAKLKSLYKSGELRLNGIAPCQLRLANSLCKIWHFLHIGKVTPYPPNFSFCYELAPGVVPTIMTEADHGRISAKEIHELERLIGDKRYNWFLNHQMEGRDRIMLIDTRIGELEAGMTRRHNSISKEYKAWVENIGDKALVLDDPFEKIPGIDIESGRYRWFNLERQLLKEKRTLEAERRVYGCMFGDLLAAITNGLIEKGEMEEGGPPAPGKDEVIGGSDGESDIYSAN